MSEADPLSRELAELHAETFDAPWTAQAFAGLLNQPGMMLEAEPGGFILARVAGDEAEILTLAVRPTVRREGIASRLVAAAAVRSASAGAERLLLEVAEDNAAARALYAHLGFETAARRRRYYARPDGESVDALLLVLNLAGRLPSR
ncbi:GNAT family N-acetyltransferase [Brevundimonas sp. R86498]|uniref:GNAT family N-acetyltransferase n=1 Tax=Brevundimonas sp. R86498 TaxID=3093845 RepID=UPI0037C7EF3B